MSIQNTYDARIPNYEFINRSKYDFHSLQLSTAVRKSSKNQTAMAGRTAVFVLLLYIQTQGKNISEMD